MTPIKRRAFIQFAGLAPAVAIAGFAAPRVAAAKASQGTLTRSAFERCLGDDFRFDASVFDGVVARLASVEAYAGCRSDSERERRFSVRFDVRGAATLEQGSYRVSHARLGDFVMFVSARDPAGRSVEAVFNRL